MHVVKGFQMDIKTRDMAVSRAMFSISLVLEEDISHS